MLLGLILYISSPVRLDIESECENNDRQENGCSKLKSVDFPSKRNDKNVLVYQAFPKYVWPPFVASQLPTRVRSSNDICSINPWKSSSNDLWPKGQPRHTARPIHRDQGILLGRVVTICKMTKLPNLVVVCLLALEQTTALRRRGDLAMNAGRLGYMSTHDEM